MARRRQKRRPAEKPLISHSSILILSAYLIGVLSGKLSDPRAELMVYLVGAFGLVAYLGLGHLAARRQRAVRRRKEKQAAVQLERRVTTLVPRHLPPDSRTTRRSRSDRQYIPVVQSQRALPGRLRGSETA